MSFTPDFSGTISSGVPTSPIFSDTSVGSDGAIAKRRIYLLQSDGTYLVPSGTTTDYSDWAYADSSITLNVLTQDTALTATTQWLNSSNVVLYEKTISFGFTAYNETFYYGLTQTQVPIQFPAQVLATNYYQNKMALRVLIDSGDQAISFASDIMSAQIAYDSATFLVTNASFNF